MEFRLDTVRAINHALDRALQGRGGYVFCEVEGQKRRICKARTVQKKFQVRVLSSGAWVIPTKVWHE